MNQTLTIRQQRFCELYATKRDYFGNGTRAYCIAYGLDPTKQSEYRTAKTNATRLLTNAAILAKINQLLEEKGLNDSFVDKQLLFLITQNADLTAKIAAIREYNKLRLRIKDRNTESHNQTRSGIVIYKPERY